MTQDALSARGRARSSRGRLHVYLGAAAGVGKTYAMLSEGVRLADAGFDVVVGLVETHHRADTEAMLRTLQCVPPKQIRYRGLTLGEPDVERLLARHPDGC